MTNEFCSILSGEFGEYMRFLNKTAQEETTKRKKGYSLKSLDRFLVENNIASKTLSEEIIATWLNSKPNKARTKATKLGHLRGFVKYLQTLGLDVDSNIPNNPIIPNDYTPYIFSDEEFRQIIIAADNPLPNLFRSQSELVFPMLLRVLYGCGMRLGEAISLKWENIDLEHGIIDVVKAKNLKQRRLPIHDSLRLLLARYKEATFKLGICREYVFESSANPDAHYHIGVFRHWFLRILDIAGVVYVRKTPTERGPCPHCLRHLFTIHSFMKSESEGRSFEETVPFLSTYLGHRDIMETEKYLRADYIIYTQSHKRVSEHIDSVFPEVVFD